MDGDLPSKSLRTLVFPQHFQWRLPDLSHSTQKPHPQFQGQWGNVVLFRHILRQYFKKQIPVDIPEVQGIKLIVESINNANMMTADGVVNIFYLFPCFWSLLKCGDMRKSFLKNKNPPFFFFLESNLVPDQKLVWSIYYCEASDSFSHKAASCFQCCWTTRFHFKNSTHSWEHKGGNAP